MNNYALITGATSGIGEQFANLLALEKYNLFLTGRREDKLKALKKELENKYGINVDYYALDLNEDKAAIKLYDEIKSREIEIDYLINNAGFGLLGEFSETNIDKELDMINTNIKAVHILTKLFLQDFILRDKGYILNVSSSASFLAGPLMSTYYATKNYVSRLTEAIYEELRRKKSNVYVGLLCPGPVDTEFNEVANVKFSLKGQSSEYVAKYAIDKMFKRKLIIIPGFKMKFICSMNKFVPKKLLLKITYNIQKKKDV